MYPNVYERYIIIKSMVLESLNKLFNNQVITIHSALDIFNGFKFLKECEQEVFIVVCLDNKSKIIAKDIVGIGTLDSLNIHPRDVFRRAIYNNTAKIITIHNHPSGDPSPSKEDIEVTKRLVDAGDLLDIKVLDHIIVGKETYWSWLEDTKS